MMIKIGDIVELKNPSLHHPKFGLVTNVSKHADKTCIDLQWTPTHSGSILLSGIAAVVPLKISSGPWIKGLPSREGFYETRSPQDFFPMYIRFLHKTQWSVGIHKTSGLAAVSGTDLYITHAQNIKYRRQSPEYAARLRAKGLPVGEVHGE